VTSFHGVYPDVGETPQGLPDLLHLRVIEIAVSNDHDKFVPLESLGERSENA
jgi:hypothetical protein